MKNLLCLIIISISLYSCNVLSYNPLTDKINNLRIGMSKDEAISTMGNKYYLESISQEENGELEILKCYSSNDIPYLLHFLNGTLILINRHYPPYVPEQKITIKQE